MVWERLREPMSEFGDDLIEAMTEAIARQREVIHEALQYGWAVP
jgi:hypothetical protein